MSCFIALIDLLRKKYKTMGQENVLELLLNFVFFSTKLQHSLQTSSSTLERVRV